MSLCTPEYLRELASSPIGNTAGHRDGLLDAADEIERLMTENESLKLTLIELNANRNLRLAE